MPAKISVGVLVTATALYLLAMTFAFRPAAAEAQQPAVEPPTAVRVADENPPAENEQKVLMRFTTHATPIFEGGAIGQPVPFTIEIRAHESARQMLPSVQKELAAQAKREIEAWHTQTQGKLDPTDTKFDLILQRLEMIEQKIREVEKASERRPQPIPANSSSR